MSLNTAQRIPRNRRTYNKWVANQTLEDYALRFTAYKVRRFSNWRIANTAIGAISFLALEAIGGAITLNYGFANAIAAIAVSCSIIILMGIPIAYHSVKYGVDIDLLTRGAGFGYIGSTFTSLIYATFTFIFFAIEAAIIATALQLCIGLPLPIGYIVSALVIIPLVTHGVTFISRFQAWTQPFWVVLQLAPFVFIASQSMPSVRQWTGYSGLFGHPDGSINLAHFGAASAVIFSLVAQIGEQVDFLRFLPRRTHANRLRWWAALLAAGPGWMVIGGLKITAGSFLAFYAFQQGVDFKDASDPTQMYLSVFREMLGSPEMALGLAGIFVVICQLKINVTNSYAGSIAWSNFFSRLTHSHPGRVVWLVFNVMLGLLLMEFGVYKALEQTLGLYSILAVSWMGAIVADLVINKPLGLSPRSIEFKRAHLYDINPVGFGSMAISALAGLIAYLGVFGPTLAAIYTYVALISAFVLAPVLALATRGQYYIARQSPADWKSGQAIECCICEHHFDSEDMARCPIYSGPICSLCCSLDARCVDACKTDARLMQQVRGFAVTFLPGRFSAFLESRLARYIAVLTVVTALIGLVFWLIHFQSSLDKTMPAAEIATVLWKLFIIVFIIAGIIVWLFVLAQESRNFAEDEARKHTRLLMDEIQAHGETDRQLQRAKEVAEQANVAKSKYVVGLSHELRTPLSAILGYAQLLERQKGLPVYIHNAARTIKRSGEHLADMIEGLLDISKIEAGRLEIFRHKIALRPFLDQIVDMLTLQAHAKGIEFEFRASSSMPDYVVTDEKRLRQVLINLLSNAIKFTDHGKVCLAVTYRGQVATFEIEDTGIGIREADIERVFLPFERVEQAGDVIRPPGTGLGLTITKLLVEIMGGELVVRSVAGAGTYVSVRLHLSSASSSEDAPAVVSRISGYEGARRTVLVADDDANQRALLEDVLRPLGFTVIVAADGPACLSALSLYRPDILVLDIAMPGMSGWDVARQVRKRIGRGLPIVMLSADAGNERTRPEFADLCDAYLIKPFSFDELFDCFATLVPLTWMHAGEETVEADLQPNFASAELPEPRKLKQLRTLGETGFVRSIEAMLNDIEASSPGTARFCRHMRFLVANYRLRDFLAVIEEVKNV
ncbi:signal transduction histidine kinase/CheY-like chemotaxis protein [Rhizobium cellulosilyticum]|uniref:histidine kinase n=1 Tax=Aliirhizobium cellulosilyticum TaxID=393664 RepID=A0A7W6TIA9_9HYPH|nr:signal transduction histidine kinase/CheY-like chemotaxis protein [Rhizobium cellulosilyticum]MBB4413984.1 signal transduction histidine kinase/CheY-like chemotaxis protein [Rhizobium cellulosilyticum]MBB4448599.1 signal transduction histidine kinase/CheY-like chemotaxis protein [Rhizobium cellulosilyticum]